MKNPLLSWFGILVFVGGCSSPPGAIGPVPQAARTPSPGFVDVRTYLPAGHVTDGSVDYREPIQKCLDENPAVYFPGGASADEPIIYGSTAGLQTRKRARILFGPHAILKRLPSSSRLLTLGDGTHVKGLVIDGNKYAHWPRFKTQCKEAIRVGSDCLLEDCFIYDYPGYAYMVRNSVNSKFYRCRAENIGYIDLMFAVNYYFGGPSETGASDGFYIVGHHNLLVDCEMIDCQRWAYTINSGTNNTLIRCRAAEVNFHTYGFIFANGDRGRYIGCVSPNTQIDLGGNETIVVDTEASFIDARAGRMRIDGCTFYGPLFAANLVSTAGDAATGPAAPLITNNRIFMNRPWEGHPLTVMGRNGEGVVADNIVHAWPKAMHTGGGIRIENVRDQRGNAVEPELVPKREVDPDSLPRYRRAHFDREGLERRRLQFARTELARYLKKIGIDADPADQRVIMGDFPFMLDREDRGLKEQWFLPEHRPSDLTVKHVGSHWPEVKKNYGVAGPGWHFIEFEMPADPAGGSSPILHFASVDSDCQVWLNGRFLGENHEWDTPFHFNIAGAMRTGRNDLTVRVTTDYGIIGIYKPISLVLDSSPADGE